MRKSLSISLPHELEEEIAKLGKAKSLTRSEIVKLALRQFLIQQRLSSLREKLIPHAQKRGLFTDEDVFRTLDT